MGGSEPIYTCTNNDPSVKNDVHMNDQYQLFVTCKKMGEKSYM